MVLALSLFSATPVQAQIIEIDAQGEAAFYHGPTLTNDDGVSAVTERLGAAALSAVHANSASGISEQLALMALMSGVELRRSELIDYIRDVVDIFIQVGRHEGARLITELEFSGSSEMALEIVPTKVVTTPIRTAV